MNHELGAVGAPAHRLRALCDVTPTTSRYVTRSTRPEVNERPPVYFGAHNTRHFEFRQQRRHHKDISICDRLKAINNDVIDSLFRLLFD